MKFPKVLLLIVCLFVVKQINAQQILNLKRTEQPIKIDGVLDTAWNSFEVMTDFLKSAPIDTGKAKSQTEVRICYDDKFFYVYALCHESKEGKYIVQSLKRDFSYPRTDAFVVFIDPYSDGVNGFSFSCNPYGSQREGLLESGGAFGVTTSWDNKWYSETTISDTAWAVEMAIPFNSLRFNEKNRNWKINFSRNDQKINETSTWVHVPRNFNVANLAFTADVVWEENPPVSGKNISLIPYVIAGSNDDKGYIDAGGDAKIGLTSSLNLDLTVNPNFSTVEVDQQVTNLDRFEIFFPERRQFFIENSDLFSSLGSANTRPFFSRRIGIGVDSTGKRIENPIIGGARVSGKLNDNWRLGAMSIQTSNGKNHDINSESFNIASVQRKVFKRSTIGAFLMDKEVFNKDFKYQQNNFVRLAGSEFNFNSHDSKWTGKTYVHGSTDSTNNLGINQGLSFSYSSRSLNFGLSQEYVSDDFNTEIGYVRRKNYLFVKPTIEFVYYPKKGKFIYQDIGGGIQNFYGDNLKANDLSYYVYYKSQLKTTASMQLTYSKNFVVLQRDFDPSGSGGLKLAIGTSYQWNSVNYLYTSNERKPLFLDIRMSGGGYYNGERYAVSGSLRYRIVPKFVFSLNYSYDKIILPKGYNSVDWILLGPQTEILFTTKLFWTTYFQYNQQLDNINVNSRLQWRFKPASDLFIVYTNNFLPENLANKSRGIVVKFTYWFNI